MNTVASKHLTMENNADNPSYREPSCCGLRMLRSATPVYRWAALGSWAATLLVALVAVSAQNVVSSYPSTATLEPITVSDEDLQRVVDQVPARRRDESADSPRLRKKLENHVGQLVEAFPYQAFQHTLGISNYEIYFNHPDELFYTLSIALPYRAERVTWYMAFGDRLIGGENYTNPPHFARSLFAAGALVEHLDAEQLTRFIVGTGEGQMTVRSAT